MLHTHLYVYAPLTRRTSGCYVVATLPLVTVSEFTLCGVLGFHSGVTEDSTPAVRDAASFREWPSTFGKTYCFLSRGTKG
jgi:hypothetical protein